MILALPQKMQKFLLSRDLARLANRSPASSSPSCPSSSSWSWSPGSSSSTPTSPPGAPPSTGGLNFLDKGFFVNIITADVWEMQYIARLTYHPNCKIFRDVTSKSGTEQLVCCLVHAQICICENCKYIFPSSIYLSLFIYIMWEKRSERIIYLCS